MNERDYQRKKSYKSTRKPFAVRRSNWIQQEDKPPLCGIHNIIAIWHRNKARPSGGQWVCPICSRLKSNGQRRHWKIHHTNPLEYNLKKSFTSAKCHSKKVNRAFTISFDFIMNLWKTQDGKCAITGQKMDHIPGDKTRKKNKVTMDRINSSKGYTPDNVWLICNWVNTAKTDLSKKELLIFAHSILRIKNRLQ